MTNKLTTEQEKRFDFCIHDGQVYDYEDNEITLLVKDFLADEIARAERKAVEDFVDYATIRNKGTIKVIDEVNDYLHTTKYYYLAINKKGEK